MTPEQVTLLIDAIDNLKYVGIGIVLELFAIATVLLTRRIR